MMDEAEAARDGTAVFDPADDRVPKYLLRCNRALVLSFTDRMRSAERVGNAAAWLACLKDYATRMSGETEPLFEVSRRLFAALAAGPNELIGFRSSSGELVELLFRGRVVIRQKETAHAG